MRISQLAASIQLTRDLHEAWHRPMVLVRGSMPNRQKQSAYRHVQSASTTLLITFHVHFASNKLLVLPLRRVNDSLRNPTETARTRRDTQLYESVGLRTGGHGGRVDYGERLGHGSVDALRA